MKTNFNDFLNEYRESFNSDSAVKDVLKIAFGDEEYNEKTIVDEIFKLKTEQTLPSAVDSIIKKYPLLKDFKQELIIAMEEE